MAPPLLDVTLMTPSSSSSSSSSFRKVATMFQSTYHDLEIRSEVQDVLQGMLWDIELTAHLQEQLEQEDQVTQWADALQHQRQELEAAHRQAQQSQRTYQKWADQLVKELWLFSQDYGQLLEKQQTTTLQLQRELERTKEQLAMVLATTTTTTTKGDTVAADVAASVAATVAPAVSSIVAPDVTPAPSREDESTFPLSPVMSTVTSTDSKDSVAVAARTPPPAGTTPLLHSEATTAATTATVTETTSTPAPAAVVTLMTASEEEEAEHIVDIPASTSSITSFTAPAMTTAPPTLVGLEIELLMHIFGFLDALDILNTAQANIAMYSKVDSLFGLGANSSGRSDMGGESSRRAAAAAAAAATTTPSTSTAAPVATGKTQPPSTAAVVKPVSIADPGPAPTQSTVVATSATSSKASPETSTMSSSSSLLLGGGKGLFSLLSSSSSSTGTAAAAAAKSHKPSGSSSSFPLGILSSSSSSSAAAASTPSQLQPQPQDKHPQPWTRSMADSLAKKLTDAEMSAIISMTVKLRQRNQDVDQLKLEREELLGKVQGMESIRQYLLDKIRQVELTLTKTRDDTIRVTQQSASDQEVIAFLDTRVQELEREVQTLTKSKQQLQEESNQTQSLLSQKVSVLSDLLQFERERYRDHDREAKATKKVLVKEVKQCRAQIVALQAQRDGCMEENEKLRNAILSMNVTNSSSS